jgi:succinate dehydrogenase / fumarate reductase flavoprotein subunit
MTRAYEIIEHSYDVDWLKHTLAWLEEDGRVPIDYRPVHLRVSAAQATYSRNTERFP